jgi:hypothetical protein
MSSLTRQIDLTGGESVYCINTYQIEKAQELFEGTDAASTRIRAEISRLESELSRNERAAIAMLLLKRLQSGSGLASPLRSPGAAGP